MEGKGKEGARDEGGHVLVCQAPLSPRDLTYTRLDVKLVRRRLSCLTQALGPRGGRVPWLLLRTCFLRGEPSALLPGVYPGEGAAGAPVAGSWGTALHPHGSRDWRAHSWPPQLPSQLLADFSLRALEDQRLALGVRGWG